MLIFNLILLRFITASSATSDQLRIVCNECVDYVKKSENCELNHDVLSDTVINKNISNERRMFLCENFSMCNYYYSIY